MNKLTDLLFLNYLATLLFLSFSEPSSSSRSTSSRFSDHADDDLRFLWRFVLLRMATRFSNHSKSKLTTDLFQRRWRCQYSIAQLSRINSVTWFSLWNVSVLCKFMYSRRYGFNSEELVTSDGGEDAWLLASLLLVIDAINIILCVFDR